MFNIGDRVRASKDIGAQCVLEGQTGTVTEVFSDNQIGCYHEGHNFVASEGLVQRTGFVGAVKFRTADWATLEICVKADEIEEACFTKDETAPCLSEDQTKEAS